MGSFTYDGTRVRFDDRILTHLQIVIVKKFQRGDSFLMSWRDSPAAGDGRASIWRAPNIPLSFRFLGSRVPAVNRGWLETLRASADSSTGLIVTDEDGNVAHCNAGNEHSGAVRSV